MAVKFCMQIRVLHGRDMG